MKSLSQVALAGNQISAFEQVARDALPSIQAKSFATLAAGTPEQFKNFDAGLFLSCNDDYARIRTICEQYQGLVAIMKKDRSDGVLCDELLARTAGLAIFANAELIQHLTAVTFYLAGLYAKKGAIDKIAVEAPPFKMRLSYSKEGAGAS